MEDASSIHLLGSADSMSGAEEFAIENNLHSISPLSENSASYYPTPSLDIVSSPQAKLVAALLMRVLLIHTANAQKATANPSLFSREAETFT